MSIEFFVTSLIVVASPGIGVLYTLAAGLSRGSRASVVAAFACTLGIVPHMAGRNPRLGGDPAYERALVSDATGILSKARRKSRSGLRVRSPTVCVHRVAQAGSSRR
jgi:hypothetical protein